MIHWVAATRGQAAVCVCVCVSVCLCVCLSVCMALHIRQQDLQHCLCISEVLSQAAGNPPMSCSSKPHSQSISHQVMT